MSDIWLAGYKRVDLGLAGGTYDDRSRPKLCWHTTEGSSIAGARNAFRRYPPHLCYDPISDGAEQYVPLNRHAFAFAGAESDDEYIVQVEVVGFAASSSSWSDRVLERLYRRVVVPVAKAVGVPPIVVPAGFRGPGGGIVLASARSPIRLTAAQLRAFSGHLGHQHIPSPDSHWDPGALPITKILAYGGQEPQSQQDEEAVDMAGEIADIQFRKIAEESAAKLGRHVVAADLFMDIYGVMLRLEKKVDELAEQVATKQA